MTECRDQRLLFGLWLSVFLDFLLYFRSLGRISSRLLHGPESPADDSLFIRSGCI
jgi:hypothetical protein